MEQASSTAGDDRPGSALARSWDAWEEYYRQASLRRRAHHGHRQVRDEKRRRRIRERIAIALSAFLIAGLTFSFYLVLTR